MTSRARNGYKRKTSFGPQLIPILYLADQLFFGSGSQRRAPSRLLGLPEKSLRLIDGLFNHINRHLERSRKHGDESGTLLEIPRVKLFKPSQTLRDVPVAAAPYQLRRTQAEFVATTAHKSLDFQYLLLDS